MIPRFAHYGLLVQVLYGPQWDFQTTLLSNTLLHRKNTAVISDIIVDAGSVESLAYQRLDIAYELK